MEVMIGFNASTGKFYRTNGFLTHKSSEPSESAFQHFRLPLKLFLVYCLDSNEIHTLCVLLLIYFNFRL